jgi:putative glutamine amidotransferase
MADKKRKIGITLRVETIEKYNEKRDAISQQWTEFLEKTGSVPVFIPNMLNDTKSYLAEMQLDAIILSGGDNKGDNPDRDKTEKEILEFSIEKQIPILGVCRGMQVINYFFGGSQITSGDLLHVGKDHQIIFQDQNFVNYYDSKKIHVNSYHHNLILRTGIGKNLEIFAISDIDSTVEGFYHKELPIIGVMWHPEREKNVEKELKLMNVLSSKKLWKK